MAQVEKPKSRLEGLEEVVLELAEKVNVLVQEVAQLKKTAIKKPAGLFGGKREKVAIKDTKTSKIYVSKSAVGKALAEEADTETEDHFAWYKLQAKFPERFVEASAEEKTKADKVEAARVAKEVEEANIKLTKEAK